MPIGLLTDEMLEVLRPIVEGQEVWDLGAGDGGHARSLLKLGASEVVCVDKVVVPTRRGIRAIHARFREIPHDQVIPVALVSWPPNYYLPELNRLTLQAGIVIYLGSNTGGSACGDHSLFISLYLRQLVAHVPNYRNTLMVYGKIGGRREPMTGEEYAVFSGQLLQFEEAQGYVQRQ